jgi:hypothetical protein
MRLSNGVTAAWMTVCLLAALTSCNGEGGGLCSGSTCKQNERCCGPPECGFCVDKYSRVACPSQCPGDDGGSSTLCGGKTCGKGYACCGPPQCGFCVPENSGAYCPSECASPCNPSCKSADEICVVKREVNVVGQACQPLPKGCENDRTCGCVGSGVCVGSYNHCDDNPAESTVTCVCQTCQVNPP